MKRIHASLAGTKKSCALGTYAARKSFPLEEYFQSIDAFKVVIEAKRERWGKDPDDNAALLTMLSGLLDQDEELMTYILNETQYDIGGDGGDLAWKKVCDALGWTLIQEYDKALEARRWPK